MLQFQLSSSQTKKAATAQSVDASNLKGRKKREEKSLYLVVLSYRGVSILVREGFEKHMSSRPIALMLERGLVKQNKKKG
jgi:hypothetical protein